MEESGGVALAEAGAIPPLISLLCDGSDGVKSEAAAALCNIAIDGDYKVVIEAGAIPPLISLVHAGSALTQANAAGALKALALNDSNLAVVSAGAIPPLIALVKNGDDDGKFEAVGALWNISKEDANRVTIHEEGGLAVLLAVLRDGSKNAKHDALGALCKLYENKEWKVTRAATGVISNVAAAAGALANLALNSNVAVAIVEAGGIPALVAVIRTSNSCVAKKWASGAMVNLSVRVPNCVTTMLELSLIHI